jgi:hypothetical protein
MILQGRGVSFPHVREFFYFLPSKRKKKGKKEKVVEHTAFAC